MLVGNEDNSDILFQLEDFLNPEGVPTNLELAGDGSKFREFTGDFQAGTM